MIALFRKQPWPASAELHLDGASVSVEVKVNLRAKGYRLSVPHAGPPVLTVPPHGRWADAENFLNRHAAWLAARTKRRVQPVLFKHGAIVPLRGVPHQIVAMGRIRGTVEIGADAGRPLLLVPGAPEHQSRRLTDWLKSQAESDLKISVAAHAERLGVTYQSITLRAQTSRWGSCSSTGRLNFNWKLVLAPPFVLDYVAAHEVAHLIEMNHSPAFWARVRQALPDMQRGKAWLRAHGREIMAYGVE